MTKTLDIILVSCVCLLSIGLALEIDIKPSTINGIIDQDANIMCKLDKSDNDVKEIMVLELSKDDVPIAILRQSSELSYGKNINSNVKAEGTISKSAVYDSYLHVTWNNPTAQASGRYTCLMYFLDQLSVLRESKMSTNLSVSDQDLPSAVRYLMEKMSILETELKAKDVEHETIFNLTIGHNATVDKLNEELIRQTDLLKTELDNQEANYISLINQLETELTTQRGSLAKMVNTFQNQTNKLETELGAQKTRTDQLMTQNDQLKTELQTQKTQTDQLMTQNDQLKTELKTQTDQLKTQLNKQTVELKQYNIASTKQETQLQNQITQLTDQNKALKQDLDQSVIHLDDKDSKILNTLTQLQETTRINGQTMRDLVTRENKTIRFLATRPTTGVFKNDADLIFNDVIINEGGSYYGHTGVFTAPVRGIYFFTVAICAIRNKYIHLDLRTNSGQVLTRAYIGEAQWEDCGDLTRIVELNVGETVRPVIKEVAAGFLLYEDDTPDVMNKFSGYLIKMF